MSKCIECGRDMDPFEAQQFMECRDCRREQRRASKVRNLNRGGTDQIGRKQRSLSSLGGAPQSFADEEGQE
jgi:hypothetical protein